MVDYIESHRVRRGLPESSHAAREVMQNAIDIAPFAALAAELRRLGGDPEQALRDAIAATPLQ
jgi:hypothetical protein